MIKATISQAFRLGDGRRASVHLGATTRSSVRGCSRSAGARHEVSNERTRSIPLSRLAFYEPPGLRFKLTHCAARQVTLLTECHSLAQPRIRFAGNSLTSEIGCSTCTKR